MKTYKLPEEAIKRQIRKVGTRLAVTFTIVFLGILTFTWWNGDQDSVVPIICIGLFLTILLVFSLRRGLNIAQEGLASFQIEIGADYIARSQLRASTISIHREEIEFVIEGAGGMGVYTSDKNRTIGIPSTLDASEYAEIKQLLMQWSTIRTESASVRTRNVLVNVGIFVGILAGFATVFLSSSIYLVLAAGLAVVGFYGFLAWRYWQMEGVDARLRRQFVIIAVVMVFLFAMRIVGLLI